MWLFKIQNETIGRMRKYKAKVVGRRFSHIEGVDYDDTFAPIAWYTSIETIVPYASCSKWPFLRLQVTSMNRMESR